MTDSNTGTSGASDTPEFVFAAARPRLLGLTYRMLGSMADAEDVVQEAWLKWHALGDHRAEIRQPIAWLTTVASRVAIDRLRSARTQRETYVGPWLPEPIVESPDPAEEIALADSLTFGFLTVLERLSPVERAVFLLADVFQLPFADIALTVDRNEAACRQIAHRARSRVRDASRRVDPDAATRRDLVDAFLRACVLGDVAGLRDVLSADVVLVSDGGAAVHAARRPVIGFERVCRLVLNLTKRLPTDALPTVQVINGEPGFLVADADGRVTFAMNFEVIGGQVTELRIVVSPAKLRGLTTTRSG